MTPEIIIEQVRADGVRLVLSPNGKIKASGDEGAINRWLPIIREQKPGIVAVLQSTEKITIESATPHAKAVYFFRGSAGAILGPATVDFVTQVGEGPTAQYWLFVTYDGLPISVNATQLRSQREFETQVRMKPVELIREPR